MSFDHFQNADSHLCFWFLGGLRGRGAHYTTTFSLTQERSSLEVPPDTWRWSCTSFCVVCWTVRHHSWWLTPSCPPGTGHWTNHAVRLIQSFQFSHCNHLQFLFHLTIKNTLSVLIRTQQQCVYIWHTKLRPVALNIWPVHHMYRTDMQESISSMQRLLQWGRNTTHLCTARISSSVADRD